MKIYPQKPIFLAVLFHTYYFFKNIYLCILKIKKEIYLKNICVKKKQKNKTKQNIQE